MSGELTPAKQARLLREHMTANGITQAQLARLIGRTEKHVSQVFNGKAGTGELDYWAFVLGLQFYVALRPLVWSALDEMSREIAHSPRAGEGFETGPTP